MHLPDGFLAPQITVPAYLAAGPLWAYASRRYFGRESVAALPLIGALTALALVIQTIMIPVPGGTSTHLLGTTLLAILYNPWVAFVCESLVLAVQALFLGAGGVTALAVNALAAGLIGPTAGWLAFRGLRAVNDKLATFAAAWLALGTRRARALSVVLHLVAVSTLEDVATGGALYLAYQYPDVAGIIALVLLALVVALLLLARRFIRALFGSGRKTGGEPSAN